VNLTARWAFVAQLPSVKNPGKQLLNLTQYRKLKGGNKEFKLLSTQSFLTRLQLLLALNHQHILKRIKTPQSVYYDGLSLVTEK